MYDIKYIANMYLIFTGKNEGELLEIPPIDLGLITTCYLIQFSEQTPCTFQFPFYRHQEI